MLELACWPAGEGAEGRNLEANLEEFERVWPAIARFAGDHNVKVGSRKFLKPFKPQPR